MKFVVATSALVLFLIATPFKAFACSCMVPSAPLVALEASDFVFSGVVKNITPINSEYGRTLLIRMDVLTRWKGDFSKAIVVETADNSAACGFPFQRGKSYLVYGHVYENMPQTNICTRTRLLENADEDIADLDEGEEVYSPRCGGPTNAVVIQTFMFLLVGISLLRKKPMIERHP